MVGIVSTQACEDTFNHMKNSLGNRSRRKYRTPQKLMAVVLSKRVLSNIHKYTEVEVDRRPACVGAPLTADIFRARRSASSLPFQSIVSTSSTTPWPSPGAQNYCCAHADLALLSAAMERDEWAYLDSAWLGTLVRPKHQLLIRDARLGGPWLFAIRSWPDSAVLCFPAKTMKVPGTDDLYWEPDLSFDAPTLMPFWRLDGLEAVAYVWRPPSWQVATHPAMRELSPALRAFSSAGVAPMPLLTVAAECAFWDIERSTLVRLGGFVGAHIEPSMSLFDVVTGLIKHALPEATDERVITIMKQRVAMLSRKNEWTDDLLEVDEAAELLQPGDVKQLRTEQKAARETQAETQKFKACYKERAKVIATKAAEAVAGAGQRARKRGKNKAVAEGVGYPSRVPRWPEHSVSIEAARSVVPRGATLWRDVRFGNWQGHFQPYPRISRSWARYGELPALRLVLQNLWSWWLLDRGLDQASCPVEGIFDGAEASGAAPSASSSGAT